MSTINATGTIIIQNLGGTNIYEYNGTQYAMPITLVNTNPTSSILEVLYDDEGFPTTDPNIKFIIGSNKITFSAINYPMNIQVSPWAGFLEITGGYTDIVVDVAVRFDGNFLTISSTPGEGMICKKNCSGALFTQNCFFENTLGSPVPLNDGCGGIVGENSHDVVFNSCNSSTLIGANAGGFVGKNSYNITFNNCIFIGSIGNNAGGMVGSDSYNITCNNCTSTGAIGDYAGGMVGKNSYNVTCFGCSSNGTTIGAHAGGILGSEVNLNQNTTATLVNCRSSATTIGANGGGIVGSFSRNVNCTNLRQSGTPGTDAGIIFGSNSQNNSIQVAFIGSLGPIAGASSLAIDFKNSYQLRNTPQGNLAYQLLTP